ncbi:MAG: hypothetical protein KJ634_07570 [Gammaproteobacteria bacterium]|nr:hypothetical protein [Gammaproteobacteria bacterium]MBU1415467.1 hypothetical protein [Gammaproteobacteria bacterium]
MKTALIAISLACIGGCGLGDTAVTAAVAGKSKAQEVEQAQAAQQKVISEVQQAQQQADQRLRDAEGR